MSLFLMVEGWLVEESWTVEVVLLHRLDEGLQVVCVHRVSVAKVSLYLI